MGKVLSGMDQKMRIVDIQFSFPRLFILMEWEGGYASRMAGLEKEKRENGWQVALGSCLLLMRVAMGQAQERDKRRI